MPTPLTARLEALLASGTDNAMLRLTLGRAALDDARAPQALAHLLRAVELDAQQSVAWKFLGKAHLAMGDPAAARTAWQQGLACAQRRGDAQVEKELGVFLRRLDKTRDTTA